MLRQLPGGAPIFLAGFSLGGNVVLKLAGELGESAVGLIAGVMATSTPIDLAACVRKLDQPSNLIYARRFVTRLKERVRAKERITPGLFDLSGLNQVQNIYEFDDRFTAQAFGFGSADNYYATQSSNQFLDRIRVPTLLVQAKDDPLIPFAVYDHPAFCDESPPAPARHRAWGPPRIHLQNQAALLAGPGSRTLVIGSTEQGPGRFRLLI